MRVQKGSATLHVEDPHIRYDLYSQKQAEISALENSGRLPASAYEGATMYTSLSPCDMCTGACILYKVARVVIAENKTFVGGEEYLKQRGIEVVVLDNAECKELMKKFIEEKSHVWCAAEFRVRFNIAD
jgi:cytosine/creatinine deaminase